MNKYRWLVALVVLVLASLACQTVMGGGPELPQYPQNTPIPQSPNNNDSGGDGPAPTDAPPPSDNGGSDAGDVKMIDGFPVPSDASSVVTAGGVVTFVTNLSVDEVVNFYRDEYGKQGLTERTSMSVVMEGQLFNLVFDGDASGKAISISGADMGDGTTSVTLTKQDF